VTTQPDTPPDAPQEGRPTTPQTEAADFWAIAGITELQRMRLAQAGYRIEAAAGALPSVEATLYYALKRLLEHFEWYAPDNDETDDVKGQAIKALRLHDAAHLDALAAAPPEASER
jgi:hypothetical protein